MKQQTEATSLHKVEIGNSIERIQKKYGLGSLLNFTMNSTEDIINAIEYWEKKKINKSSNVAKHIQENINSLEGILLQRSLITQEVYGILSEETLGNMIETLAEDVKDEDSREKTEKEISDKLKKVGQKSPAKNLADTLPIGEIAKECNVLLHDDKYDDAIDYAWKHLEGKTYISTKDKEKKEKDWTKERVEKWVKALLNRLSEKASKGKGEKLTSDIDILKTYTDDERWEKCRKLLADGKQGEASAYAKECINVNIKLIREDGTSKQYAKIKELTDAGKRDEAMAYSQEVLKDNLKDTKDKNEKIAFIHKFGSEKQWDKVKTLLKDDRREDAIEYATKQINEDKEGVLTIRAENDREETKKPTTEEESFSFEETPTLRELSTKCKEFLADNKDDLAKNLAKQYLGNADYLPKKEHQKAEEWEGKKINNWLKTLGDNIQKNEEKKDAETDFDPNELEDYSKRKDNVLDETEALNTFVDRVSTIISGDSDEKLSVDEAFDEFFKGRFYDSGKVNELKEYVQSDKMNSNFDIWEKLCGPVTETSDITVKDLMEKIKKEVEQKGKQTDLYSLKTVLGPDTVGKEVKDQDGVIHPIYNELHLKELLEDLKGHVIKNMDKKETLVKKIDESLTYPLEAMKQRIESLYKQDKSIDEAYKELLPSVKNDDGTYKTLKSETPDKNAKFTKTIGSDSSFNLFVKEQYEYLSNKEETTDKPKEVPKAFLRTNQVESFKDLQENGKKLIEKHDYDEEKIKEWVEKQIKGIKLKEMKNDSSIINSDDTIARIAKNMFADDENYIVAHHDMPDKFISKITKSQDKKKKDDDRIKPVIDSFNDIKSTGMELIKEGKDADFVLKWMKSNLVNRKLKETKDEKSKLNANTVEGMFNSFFSKEFNTKEKGNDNILDEIFLEALKSKDNETVASAVKEARNSLKDKNIDISLNDAFARTKKLAKEYTPEKLEKLQKSSEKEKNEKPQNSVFQLTDIKNEHPGIWEKYKDISDVKDLHQILTGLNDKGRWDLGLSLVIRIAEKGNLDELKDWNTNQIREWYSKTFLSEEELEPEKKEEGNTSEDQEVETDEKDIFENLRIANGKKPFKETLTRIMEHNEDNQKLRSKIINSIKGNKPRAGKYTKQVARNEATDIHRMIDKAKKNAIKHS